MTPPRPHAHADCPLLPIDANRCGVHAVQFYEHDAQLADLVARFVAAGIGGGDAVAVIARGAECRRIAAMLTARGIDVSEVERRGYYRAVDAERFIATLLDGSDLNRAVLEREVRPQMLGLRGPDGGRVRVFGETVSLLWERGHTHAALDLEEWWNGFARDAGLSVLCCYPVSAFLGAADDRLAAVCARHTAVIPGDGPAGQFPAPSLFEPQPTLRDPDAQACAALLAGLSAHDRSRVVEVTRVVAHAVRQRRGR